MRSVSRRRSASMLLAGALLAASPVLSEASGRIALHALAGHGLRFHDVTVLADGRIVTVGYSMVAGDRDAMDGLVAELGADGELQRVRTFDLGGEAQLTGVAATSDGGWVAAGYAPGTGGERTAWILRADAFGNPVWSRLLVSAQTSESLDVVVTDMGFVTVGRQGSRAWIAGLGQDGLLSWDWRFVEVNNFRQVIVAPDGALLAVGTAMEPQGDAWTVQVSAAGVVLTQALFDTGTSADNGNAVAALRDGGTAVGGFAGFSNKPFVLRTAPSGDVTWRREWDVVGGVEGLLEETDGTLVVIGSTGGYAWFARLDAAGNELDRMRFSPGVNLWEVVALPSGHFLVVGGSYPAVTAMVPPDWSRLRACSAALPDVGSAFDSTTRADGTFVPAVVGAVPTDALPLIAEIDLVVTMLCPDSPAEPSPIFVHKAGSDIVIRFSEPVDATSFNVHEGPIGSFRPPSWSRCHAAAGDPGVARAPDGTVDIAHAPAPEDAWFLVSASNEAGESALGRGSDGPLDVPPSAWRCGASR